MLESLTAVILEAFERLRFKLQYGRVKVDIPQASLFGGEYNYYSGAVSVFF